MKTVKITNEYVSFLCCIYCGKQVSTGYVPLPTDTPDRGLIIRAIIMCPECFEVELAERNQDDEA